MFGSNIFADPCWDMLLDLYVHAATGIQISVSSACLASGVPTATAHAHVRRLEAAGMIHRAADLKDRRRTNLLLSPSAYKALERWLLQTFLAAGARPDLAGSDL